MSLIAATNACATGKARPKPPEPQPYKVCIAAPELASSPCSAGSGTPATQLKWEDTRYNCRLNDKGKEVCSRYRLMNEEDFISLMQELYVLRQYFNATQRQGH